MNRSRAIHHPGRRRVARRNRALLAGPEPLELRTLLAITSGYDWTLADGGVDWGYVSTGDALLSEDSVPSTGPVTGTDYTIRALVEYYNSVYDGSASEPFVIQLTADDTYTLSNTTDASSIWGGRGNGMNEYGALDVDPTHTTAPLVIVGGTDTVLMSQLSPTDPIPVDRLFHVIGGKLVLDDVILKDGQALDNGTGSQGTDALGGGVLVNPGGSLSVSSCSFLSDGATGSTGHEGASGFNAAGGGIYGSAGSTISINGATKFTNDWANAGMGGLSEGAVGEAGGNAFGAGLAMAADVAEPPPNTTGAVLYSELSFIALSGDLASFQRDQLNTGFTSEGATCNEGGTGGAGSHTGGQGGDAFGAGLYMGSGQLNFNGRSTAAVVQFADDIAYAGMGYTTSTTAAPGEGGTASGPGAYLSPSQVSVSDSTTTGGILQFTDDSETSYDGGTSTESGGLTLPPVNTTCDPGYTSPDGPWNLRTAVAAAGPLAATGMEVVVTLPALADGVTYSLNASTSGENSGSLAVSMDGYGSLEIIGGGASTTVIDGSGLGASVFTFSDADVTLSGLTITGADATTSGGAIDAVNCTLRISNAVISENTSDAGGGGLYQAGGTLILKNSQVTGNSASLAGGAIDAVNCETQTFSNAVISENTSGAEGGGLYQSNDTLILKNSQVTGNSASLAGGGLYVDGAGSVNMNDVTVSSNRVVLSDQASGNAVGYGGGLYISGGTLTTNDLSVDKNTIRADGDQTIMGAGIYANGVAIDFNGGSNVTTTIDGNTLKGDGAGMGFGAGISLGDGSIIGGSVLEINDNVIEDTVDGVGGAIYFLQDSSYSTSYAVTTTGNSANTGGDVYAFYVTNQSDANDNTTEVGPAGIAYFTGGTGSLRSAINYCENEMTSEGTSVSSMAIMLEPGEYNLSSTYGQLVGDVGEDDELTIIATNGPVTIDAGGQNRVLQADGAGSLVLQGLTITGGVASAEGGGIYLESGILTLNQDAITGNVAGPTGTATNPFPATQMSWSTQGHFGNSTGKTGTSGASGYGGGIYLGGGTLDLLSNTTITGNTVRAQNGAPGQNGEPGYIDGSTMKFGNGGNGGAGGDALGGGLYQAGGTLNSPVGSAEITGNTAIPGQGGAGGAAPPWIFPGFYSLGDVGPAGKPGAPGPTGQSCTNYSHAGGATVFTSKATSEALVVTGGLYSVSGTLAGPAAAASPAIPGGGALKRLPGVTVQLFAADGTLIATTTTDSNGVYRFQTDFSGMGYIQFSGISIYEKIPYGGDSISAIDPDTLRSNVVQFLSGTAVGGGLDLVLRPIATSFHDGANTVAVLSSAGGATLWQQQIMPKSYRGGFVVVRFDFNFDTTPDYILLTKTGRARVFFVDGRTGAVTAIKGTVAAGLRRGMVVQAANLNGNGLNEFILSPSKGRAGRISAINLDTRRVSWTSRQTVNGGMKVSFVGSQVPGRARNDDVRLSSQTNPQLWEVLDGQNSRVVLVHKPPHATARSATKTDVLRRPGIPVPPASIAFRHGNGTIAARASAVGPPHHKAVDRALSGVLRS